ncbi:(2Fe-2S)-binding protein [Marinisporobacter balticus]|uniref:Purine hydroxylase delta subunit apoprotein n=1 Tax=Marinisporobacter balticus TaxID=2018667 RepID=A0A4R2KRA3_9FIRM|nr:(2Fe-2S)-binding protein [Marinisporobacter balticus]TCO75257.1 purine hydroxylase delta subunit apoprotein [Marinisporobacter balticus]
MFRINFTINNKGYTVDVDEALRLVDLLRDKFQLTGTKEGCAEGECGACTVIMDGRTVQSCLVMAFQADGSNITTIEGLEREDGLHPIQRAFLDAGAVQCGFCTPGMVLSSKALLDKNSNPSREEIREGLSGNLCRCTGYNKIVDAVALASKYLKEEESDGASENSRK